MVHPFRTHPAPCRLRRRGRRQLDARATGRDAGTNAHAQSITIAIAFPEPNAVAQSDPLTESDAIAHAFTEPNTLAESDAHTHRHQ